MNVQAPAEETLEEYGNVLKLYAAAGRVRGFRKGKAPAAVIERRYAAGIDEDVRQRLVPRFYRQALKDQNINAVAIVDVADVSFNKGEGLSFNVIVDVAPEFKLPKYKRITLKKKKIEVADKDVDDAFTRLLESAARYEDVTGRPVRADDLVMIDYSGVCDGKPVAELAGERAGIGDGSDFWALAGDPEFIPGIAAGLNGMSVGEMRKINVHFPEDYRVSSVAGRDAVYTVTVKGLREKRLPEINAEFLKGLDVATEDELRGKIRESQEELAEQSENARLKNELAKYLLEKTKFDLPQSIIDQEVNLTVRSLMNRGMMQGVSREQMERNRDDLLKSATETSTERVKLSYILNRIAGAENIEVSDAELDDHLQSMAARYRMTSEKLRAEMEKRNGMEGLRSEIQAEKTLDLLMEKAKIKK